MQTVKKWMIFLPTVSLFLCSCGKKESYPNLEFPGTTWEMSIRGVLNALNLKEKDISYIYITPSGINSVLCIEGYELFGTKTKSVDLQFLDLSEPPKKEPSKEGQGLFGKKQYGIDEHLLDLVDHHELSEIIVTYPKDTDMDQILNEMKKIYGTTIPEMTMYEYDVGADVRKPKEYKESEQEKLWGTDFLAASIPDNESEAYRKSWKPFYVWKNMVDVADGVSWDTFTRTARMQSILCLNEKDRKEVQFFAYNACVYRALNKQIVGESS